MNGVYILLKKIELLNQCIKINNVELKSNIYEILINYYYGLKDVLFIH